MTENAASPDPRAGRFDVLDLAATLVRWRKVILWSTLITAAVAAIISFLVLPVYTSTASILPPKQQDLFGSMGAATSALRSLTGGLRIGGMGQRSAPYNYMAILTSRSAMESVVRHFDLITVYEIADSSMEKAIRQLEDNVAIEEETEDYISISVDDRDPHRAAAMANYFVDVLNRISIQLGTQEARNNREFIEKRIVESRAELRANEDSLRVHQERSGMILTPEQTTDASVIGTLYGLKAKREVEVAILRRTVSPDDYTLKQMQVELEEINKKVATIPVAGLESLRLYREVIIQQKVLEFLIPVYEQARIDEQKDVPVMLVLDKAIPAERRSSPKRTLITASAGLSALLLSVMYVLLVERYRRVRAAAPERFVFLSNLIHRRR